MDIDIPAGYPRWRWHDETEPLAIQTANLPSESYALRIDLRSIFSPFTLSTTSSASPPPPTSARPPFPRVFQYTSVADVEYPGAYSDFLAVVDVVNLDVGSLLSLACVYSTNFYDRLLITTIGPAGLLCLLACTYWVGRSRNRHSAEATSRVWLNHLRIALFIMFVVYSTVSYTVFQTFVCDKLDDGNSYLRADYSITCYTAKHNGFQVGVVVYADGLSFTGKTGSSYQRIHAPQPHCTRVTP